MVVMLVLQSLATVRVLNPRARVAASTPLMSTHPMLTMVQCTEEYMYQVELSNKPKRSFTVPY